MRVVGVPKFMATSGRVEEDRVFGRLGELDIDASIVEGSMDGLLQRCCHFLKELTIYI